MFKTIYRLRLLVEETSQYYPIHLCALKEKEPTYNELIRKVERIIDDKNIIKDYHLETMEKMVLSDDQSLQNALKSSDQSKLEIILCRSNNDNNELSKDDLRSNTSSRLPIKNTTVIQLNSNNSSVPVIKPTVLRWITPPPAMLYPTTTNTIYNGNESAIVNNYQQSNHHVRRYSSISQDDDDKDHIDYRKDSGVSMDEPHHYRKKQRVMSAEHHHQYRFHHNHHSRKLPDPPSTSNTASRNNNTISLHPLDIITRPSTAPPSSISPPLSTSPPPSSHPRLNYIMAPTLPALSSITSPVHNSKSLLGSSSQQLAPIHNTNSSSPPAQSLSTKPYKRSKSIATTTSSIFLCEHVNDHGKVCGQTFRRSYDLSRHQTIHLENRPFCYCDQCGKKFTRMDALRRHERVQGHTSSGKHRSTSITTTTLTALQKKTSV